MKRNRITRRTFLAGTAAAGVAFAGKRVFGIGKAAAAAGGRVIILGFDGVEPEIVREMMAVGDLPNLERLQGMGGYAPLKTTIPPQSPVAWSSFMTCKNPGGHNIFDFIRRDPKGQYGPMPYVGTGKVDHVRLGADGGVIDPPKAEAYMKGRTFWSVADEQGRRCRILNIPFAFPPDNLKNGVQLCALGVPDLRGTTSVYSSLSDAFTPAQLSEQLSGGQRIALKFDGSDTAQVDVPGPRDQRYKYGDPQAFTMAPMKVSVDRKSRQGTIEIQGRKVEFKQGEWSPWIEVEFAMSPTYKVYGVTRVFPLEVGAQVNLYMACQQYHPTHPFTPFTSPAEYSEQLRQRYGLYKTIGWAYDTHAMRQDALTEEAFMMDVRQTMAWREKLTLDELDRGEFDMLISAWTATDRVGHMFWRFRDPQHPMHDPELAKIFGTALEETYKIMDAIVGKAMERVKEGDVLMVLSDHGFESWRTGFNLNDWLRDNGYLKVSDPAKAQSGFLQGIDWAGTKAYSVGLSSMYLNLQGRESQGIVPQAEAEKTIAEIRDKLLLVKDPANGNAILRSIYTRNDYKGEAMAEAPDFSLGYHRYYQSSKSAAKGAILEAAEGAGKYTEPNINKWAGEHAASDAAYKPGIFFCSRALQKPEPDIRDLGVTSLKFLEADVPADYEGDSIV